MLYPAIWLLGFVTLSQGAVVIDRLAVTVDKHVIKLSDIDRDLRLTEFLNEEQPSFNSDNRRNAAERLVDQTIIRDEIASGGYARATDAEADALLNQIRQQRFGDSGSRLQQALARYGLTEKQLRDQLLWQLTVLRFINERFRPGVLVSDEEVHSYYDQHKAALERQYPKDSSFNALQSKIRNSLEGERINQNFSAWLDESRKQNRIEFRQGAFQ
jgi:hypothetical protein